MAYLLKLCYAFEHKLAKCLKIRRFYETINMQKREKENADDIKALRSVHAGAYYGVIRYFFYSGKCKRFHRRTDMGGRLHGGNGGEGDGVLF